MQTHRSDPRILSRRTLERDHSGLAGLLRPGMAVLDMGCGTGAITAGIAKAVGPEGSVVGLDRDEVLLELARSEHAALPNLRFDCGDATAMNFHAQFDIVTAARLLQWIADPALAIANMKRAARPGGMLVVLDYNHNQNGWTPEPPEEFQRFYRAFLAWREENGWDNDMADHLPQLFRSAGLVDIESQVQDEIAERDSPAFEAQIAIWPGVIEHVREPMGMEWSEAKSAYEAWAQTDLMRQTLSLRTVNGAAP